MVPLMTSQMTTLPMMDCKAVAWAAEAARNSTGLMVLLLSSGPPMRESL